MSALLILRYVFLAVFVLAALGLAVWSALANRGNG
jgi:hypothetical protein